MRLGYDGRRPATARPAGRVDLPSQNVSANYHQPTGHQLTPPPPHAADVKESTTRAGVVPGGGKGMRRYTFKAWSDGDPKLRVAALELLLIPSIQNISLMLVVQPSLDSRDYYDINFLLFLFLLFLYL